MTAGQSKAPENKLLQAVRFIPIAVVLFTDSTTPGEIKTYPINHPWEDDAMGVFIDGYYSRTAYPAICRNQTDFQSGGEFSLVYNGAVTSDESGFKGEFGTAWLGKTGTGEGKYYYEYKLSWRVMGKHQTPRKLDLPYHTRMMTMAAMPESTPSIGKEELKTRPFTKTDGEPYILLSEISLRRRCDG